MNNIALLLLPVGVAFGLCTQLRDAAEVPRRSPLGDAVSSKSGGPRQGALNGYRSSGRQVVYWGPNGWQEVSFGVDGTSLEVFNIECSNGKETLASFNVYDTSFEIVFVDSQTEFVFFVVGIAGDGEHVIERWKPMTAVAQSPSEGETSSTEPVRLQRTELYRGSSLGDVRSLGVDPLGQFLLVLHGNPRTLSRMQVSNRAIISIYDSYLIPELNITRRARLFPRLHATEGLIWTMEGFIQSGDARDPALVLLMHDYAKDGFLDSHRALPEDLYHDLYGLSAQSVWVDVYED